MPIRTERLAREPIIVLNYAGMPSSDEFEGALRDIVSFLDEVSPVFVINNLSELSSVNFGDMMIGLAQATRGGPGSPADTRTRHVLVGTHEMIKFAAEASKQEQYEKLDIPFFPSLQEALNYVRR